MISVSSPSLSLLPFDQAIRAVLPHFNAWEIVAEGLHNLPAISAQVGEVLASYDLQLSVHAPLSDVNIGSLNPRMRGAAMDDVLITIEHAGALGIGPVTVHPGFYSPLGHADRQGAKDATRASLKAIDKAARDCGVNVALENMPAMPISMVTDPKGLLDLLEGTELGICFDIGHANTTHNIDDYLVHVPRFHNAHFHDNQGQYDQHLVIGEGTVPFASALEKMVGYKGRFVIEARDMQGAPTSRDRLQRLLGEAHFL
jgi:sugar phosphate isomerase/epimerase